MSKFGKKIYDHMNESKLVSLRVLYEDDESKDSDDSSSSDEEESKKDSGDGFDDSLLDTDSDSSGDDPSSSDEEENKKEEEAADPEDQTTGVSEEQVAALIDGIEGLKDLRAKVIKDPHVDLALDMRQKLAASKNVMYTRKGISEFLLEKSDVKKLEKELEGLEDTLDSGYEKLNKKKKDPNLDIERYVEVAIDTLEKFDKYDKEKIVCITMQNIIANDAGFYAEKYVVDFEDAFYTRISSSRDPNEKYSIFNSNYDTSSGALKQG
jgi:hypothetical protein